MKKILGILFGVGKKEKKEDSPYLWEELKKYRNMPVVWLENGKIKKVTI
jgi:hypothetical protein